VFFIFGYFSQGLEIKKFLLFSTAYADYVLGQKSFQEILSGQVWRLVTPIFIHHGIFHIFFNLAWFSTLARQIEGYLSSRKLLLLILGIAIPSNIAFYLIASPAFGGLSGVNYGLFAYLWCRGNYSTDSALRPDQQLSQFFFVWYIICLALTLLGGMFGMKVANSIHGVGALMGIVFAVVDTHSLRQVLNTFKFNQHTRKLALIGLGLLIAGFVVDYLSMRGIS
jgi:membrane associated rhomboid family serine protease